VTAKASSASHFTQTNVSGSLGIFSRALAVWLVFIVTESILGTLRTLFLEPRIGVVQAKQIGLVVGCVALLLIAWLTINWIRAASRGALVSIGMLWAALTFAFEMALGRVLGRSWETLFADYDPVHGGLMWFAMIALLFAPTLASAWRNNRNPAFPVIRR
jgi:hypothetical protein